MPKEKTTSQDDTNTPETNEEQKEEGAEEQAEEDSKDEDTDKKAKPKPKKWSLAFSLNNEVQDEVKGDTVVELFEKIELPAVPSTPALLDFKENEGDRELHVVLPVQKVQRYIANEPTRELLHDGWERQLNSL